MKVGDVVKFDGRGTYHKVLEVGKAYSSDKSQILVQISGMPTINSRWFAYRFTVVEDPSEILALSLLGKIL
jgi:hypothetical protein